jgi:hypothetical protein
MHIPRLAREAGLAWGCGEEEERIKNYSSNHLIIVECPENR